MTSVITWTKTDESPALASASFLPIARNFAEAADVHFYTLDISFAGRIIQAFPEYLTEAQRQDPALEAMSEIVRQSDARLVKLPNASATENQLKDAIKELQGKGYALPDYPAAARRENDMEIKRRYDALTGSVVNPVMRQGNAVRSIPRAVKEAARRNPHAMGEWTAASKTKIAHMDKGDFYETEQSLTYEREDEGSLSIRFVDGKGNSITIKDDVKAEKGDIFDTAVMRRDALQDFLTDAMVQADDESLLLSLHFKATMMKKSDGVFFGDAVTTYFAPLFSKYKDIFASLGVNPQNGLNDILNKIDDLEEAQQKSIKQDIQDCLEEGPALAMADPKAAQSHLSSPNLVIIDVSMANLARWGGQVMDKNGGYGDTLAVIPDSTYARMHQAGIDFLKKNGAADPKTMGSVTTIRLQAEGAEEYGSKNTTYEAKSKGRFELVASDGTILNQQDVAKGDIWRLCRTTDRAVQNWIDLAIDYARNSQDEVIIWLDDNRAHDREMMAKVNARLAQEKNDLSKIRILSLTDAMTETLTRSFAGKNTIAVTGNLLGDHVTDYFPILEIGSSSKMLSVIQLLAGGVVAETGSGGTAPDLLNMIEHDNHFLWDDTGTALALAECLRHIHKYDQNRRAGILAETLEKAAERYLQDNRTPSPNGYDTRESHYYMALYWAQELRDQTQDETLRAKFKPLADELESAQDTILSELKEALSHKGEPGGRYDFPQDKLLQLMRPSPTLTKLIA